MIQFFDDGFPKFLVAVMVTIILLISGITGFLLPTNTAKFENLSVITIDSETDKKIAYTANYLDVSDNQIVCSNCEISKAEYDSAKLDKTFTIKYVPQYVQNSQGMFYFVVALLIVLLFVFLLFKFLTRND